MNVPAYDIAKPENLFFVHVVNRLSNSCDLTFMVTFCKKGENELSCIPTSLVAWLNQNHQV